MRASTRALTLVVPVVSVDPELCVVVLKVIL